MATTHNAWLGQVGRDDRAGIGSGRHHKLSGNNTGTRVSGVWRFADIGAHGTPAYIVNRLRDWDRTRVAHTHNNAPNDSEMSLSAPVAAVSLADGRWAKQQWHTTVLPNMAGLRTAAGETVKFPGENRI